MNQPSREEKIQRQTEEAQVRAGRTRMEVQRRRGEPPRPGEVFVFAETSEYDVQWAVIEQDRRDSRRLLVVPADVNPLAGRADVAVAADADRSALTLRCRYDLWLHADDFRVDLRTGLLDPEIVDEVKRKRAEIRRGKPDGSVRRRKTETEPEYEEAEERVRRARAVLRASFREPGRSRWWPGTTAIAASVLLAFGLGLTGGLLWQDSDQASYEEPLVSLPFAWLHPLENDDPERPRGRTTITVHEGARLFVLVLEVVNPEPYLRYRLEIRPGDGEEVWAREVAKTGPAEVIVALPRSWLGPGDYQLRLLGLDGEESQVVEEYELRIRLDDEDGF